MLFWIVCAALTAGVLLVLLLPFVRRRPAPGDGSVADLAVYRDQLEEIERDRARGVLNAEEAEASRIEISRRILACADLPPSPAPAPAPISRANSALIALATAVPLLALSTYLLVGSPGMPGTPAAERAARATLDSPLPNLVAQVEARLREHPEEGMGWDAIAPIYLRLDRYREAADAFARASRLLGETPRRLLGFAEATVLANNGVVTEPAREAYQKVLQLEPTSLEARFWLALAKEQDGDLAGAAADYRAVLSEAPAGATWRPLVAERLEHVERGGGRKLAAPARGPSAADVAAAAQLPEAERVRMIEGMVERLALRLKENGQDVGGWQQLLRAYTLLGRREKALEALAGARRAFANDKAALGEIDTFAKGLGLGS